MLKELQGTVKVSAPASISSKWSAENLIQNLEIRSSGFDLKPLLDASGTKASYDSCYKTNNVKLAALDHIMVLTFNLGRPLF